MGFNSGFKGLNNFKYYCVFVGSNTVFISINPYLTGVFGTQIVWNTRQLPTWTTYYLGSFTSAILQEFSRK